MVLFSSLQYNAPTPIEAPAMRHSGLVLLPQRHASADLTSTYDHDYVAPSAQRAPEHIVQQRARTAALDAANAAVPLACAREHGRQPLVETDAASGIREPSESSTASHSAPSSARSFGKGAAKTAAIKSNAARSRGGARRK